MAIEEGYTAKSFTVLIARLSTVRCRSGSWPFCSQLIYLKILASSTSSIFDLVVKLPSLVTDTLVIYSPGKWATSVNVTGGFLIRKSIQGSFLLRVLVFSPIVKTDH